MLASVALGDIPHGPRPRRVLNGRVSEDWIPRIQRRDRGQPVRSLSPPTDVTAFPGSEPFSGSGPSFTLRSTGLPVVHKGRTIWSLLSSAPSCSLRPLQPTFCPSNVPSKFWPLCTAVSSVLPQASTRLCKPKSKERPPHTTQSKPLALASCRRCLGVLQTPKMVCRFRPQCSFLYHFSSLTLSPSSPFPAEDKLQAEPHPEFLLSLLSLPFSVVTFAADSFTHTLCFCAAFLTPQGPQLGVPTLPASQYTTVQERPTGSLQKYYMNGANKHHL